MKLKNILTEKNQNRERTSCPLGKQTKKRKAFSAIQMYTQPPLYIWCY